MMEIREKNDSASDFLDFINYADFKTIKNLLMKYNRLEQYAAKGNVVWHSIKIDLDRALQYAGLTDKQEYCIEQHLINNCTLENIADDLNVNEKNVKKHVDCAILKIIKYLN